MEEFNVVIYDQNLSFLNDSQKQIVLTQWERHQHPDFEIDYDVSGEKDMLNGFLVKKGVWNPFIASGRYHARYLFYHTSLYEAKTAIEIGSGTGLMGVVMAKYGANKVIMSDISTLSVENSRENAKRFGVEEKVEVIEGDLFENIREKADLITWMIPFFPAKQSEKDSISRSMLMTQELFERFLVDSKSYLNRRGVILIPSFSLGGELTDPRIIGEDLGYDVKTTWSHNSINGIQRGMIYMHELKPRGEK
jgi:hypothetical protein